MRTGLRLTTAALPKESDLARRKRVFVRVSSCVFVDRPQFFRTKGTIHEVTRTNTKLLSISGVVSRFAIRYTASVIVVLAVCVMCTVPTCAATRTWTGTVNSDWTSSANWGGFVPTSVDTAVIPGGLTNYPVIATRVTINRLVINSAGSGASVSVSFSGILTVGDVDVNNNGTLVNGGTILSSGELTVDGIVTLTSGTMNVRKITVDSSGTLTVSGGTLLSNGEFTVDGTVFISSGTILMADTLERKPSDNLSINAGGIFFQSGGTVSVNDFITDNRDPAGTYNQTAGVMRIYRDFNHDGIFDARGGTIEFNGDAGHVTRAATPIVTQFFNVVLNADPDFDNRAISIGVGGNWTANVTIDLSNRNTTVLFNGSGAQTIGGPSPTIFANVIVNKPSGTTLTLANTQETNNGNLTVTSGTLDLSSFRIDRVSKGGTLTVDNGAFLKLGGTNTFPVRYLNHLLGPTSTVEYSGTTQVVTGESYGHLILSGISAKTLPTLLVTRGNFTMSGTASATLAGLMTVDGNFTLNANTTFRASSLPHTIKGNFTNSGTFNAGNSTTILNGTSVQTIGGSNATTFNSLTINNSSGVVLNGVDTTVNDTLTFTSGTITTGANKVIIPFGGNVSRTSGHVVGNLQKYFFSGGRSATFEIGSATAYTPINILFATVSVPGNLIASTTTGDHPNIGSSTMNPAKTANRYWTLTNSGIGFANYNATFNFVSADRDAGANPANFIVGRFSSGWTYPPVGTKAPTSTQATGITGFGDFQLGETGGAPSVGLVKSVSPTGIQPPGTDLVYSVAFTNSGSSVAVSVQISDPIPANTDFKVGSATRNLGTTGLQVVVTYSNNSGATYTYTPVTGGGGAPPGYDRNVTNIRWIFTGSLSPISPNNTGSVSFTTRIR